MYRTKKILSLEPASQPTTGLARNAIFMALPFLATALVAFAAACSRVPPFGILIGAFGALYLPLFIASRRSNVTVSKTMEVSWHPVRRPNAQLLKNSFYTLILMAVFGTILFLR